MMMPATVIELVFAIIAGASFAHLTNNLTKETHGENEDLTPMGFLQEYCGYTALGSFFRLLAPVVASAFLIPITWVITVQIGVISPFEVLKLIMIVVFSPSPWIVNVIFFQGYIRSKKPDRGQGMAKWAKLIILFYLVILALLGILSTHIYYLNL